jgi:hypothetical protein
LRPKNSNDIIVEPGVAQTPTLNLVSKVRPALDGSSVRFAPKCAGIERGGEREEFLVVNYLQPLVLGAEVAAGGGMMAICEVAVGDGGSCFR